MSICMKCQRASWLGEDGRACHCNQTREELEIALDRAAARSLENAREATRVRVQRDAITGHLGRVLQMFREETSAGDGIREDHVPMYEAAKAALKAKESS